MLTSNALMWALGNVYIAAAVPANKSAPQDLKDNNPADAEAFRDIPKKAAPHVLDGSGALISKLASYAMTILSVIAAIWAVALTQDSLHRNLPHVALTLVAGLFGPSFVLCLITASVCNPPKQCCKRSSQCCHNTATTNTGVDVSDAAATTKTGVNGGDAAASDADLNPADTPTA